MPPGVHPKCPKCGIRVNSWAIDECVPCMIRRTAAPKNDDDPGYDRTVT